MAQTKKLQSFSPRIQVQVAVLLIEHRCQHVSSIPVAYFASHLCSWHTNHLFSYIPSQCHVMPHTLGNTRYEIYFPNFGKYKIYFPKHKIYYPCGIFCQPSDSVLLAHKSSFIISLESEAETIWILGVSRLRRLISISIFGD